MFSYKILDLAQESIVKVTNSLFCEELLEYSSGEFDFFLSKMDDIIAYTLIK